MWFSPPAVIPARLHASLPEAFRKPRPNPWVDANRGGGVAIDSFLEGPCFDAAGVLHVTDIPYGRIFRIREGGHWDLLTEYEGWPNGMAFSPSPAPGGAFLITDYRHGLLSLDPATGAMTPVLETVLSESFKGLNDLVIAADGAVLFTDQGQSGLQDPSGRVWRLSAAGARLDRLIGNGPSPNGIALSHAGTHCYVAMTRSCEIWRFALRRDAVVGKAQCFCRIPAGISGPDGLAVDAHERVFVSNPGHGQVWVVDPHGVIVARIDCSGFGRHVTNCAFAPDGRTLFMTESGSGRVLVAEIPPP